jgi:hypothetical protein
MVLGGILLALGAVPAWGAPTVDITRLVGPGRTIRLAGGRQVALQAPLPPAGTQVQFIDLKPGANWSHPALIRVRDAAGKVIEEIPVRRPPEGLNRLLPPAAPVQFKLNDLGGKLKVGDPKRYYALLINGAADQRHWNDFSFLYRVLTQVYGYLPEQIFVADSNFIGNSPDLDGDGKPDIRYESTVAGVKDLMTSLKAQVPPEAQLLVATDDHGDQLEGESTLVLNDQDLKASEFAALLKEIPAGTVLSIHEPCYSGGFVRPSVGSRRVAMAAAMNFELSWASPDLDFDEFIYQVVSAFAFQRHDGTPVAADANGDGLVSAQEAFGFAVANERRAESPLLEAENGSGASAAIGLK